MQYQYQPSRYIPGHDKRPEEVAGYKQAQKLGLVSFVPSSHPIVKIPTARQELRHFKNVLGIAFVELAVLVTMTIIIPSLMIELAVIFFIVVAIFVYLYRQWNAYIQVFLSELLMGYTTSPFIIGGTKCYTTRRWKGVPVPGIPWDYRGVWVVDDKEHKDRVPDGLTPPPGIYPSPTKEGKWELWTGAVWSGQYYKKHPLENRERSL